MLTFTPICFGFIAPWTNVIFLRPIFNIFILFFLSVLISQLSWALISRFFIFDGHIFLTYILKFLIMTIHLRNASFTIIDPFADHFNNTTIYTKVLLYGIHTVNINRFLRSLVNCLHTPPIFMIIGCKGIVTFLADFLQFFCCVSSCKLDKRLSSLLSLIWSITLPSNMKPL